MLTKPAGLYIHIPFCQKKCSYCDFYSITDLSKITPFIKALKREMQMGNRKPLVFDTLYAGGGTPSVLGADAIGQIVENARRYFKIQPNAEMTLEVNPATVTLDNLKSYLKSGVNRLNIGVQSFQNQNLRFLGRLHTAADALLSIKWAQQAGFNNIGLDLIYGLAGQDKKNWLKDLKRAIEIEPQHLACYMLTTESGTPLDRDVKTGRTHLPADETVRELFDTTIDFLASHGFEHYEISNFSRRSGDDGDSFVSKHNMKYWSFAPYIGLGPSAHSFIEPERFWNHRSVEKYMRQIEAGILPLADKEKLTKEQMIMEAVYLGFRTIRGIDLDRFHQKFGLNFKQTFKDTIGELQNDGLLKLRPKHCALSRKGLPFLDSIASMFIGQEISG